MSNTTMTTIEYLKLCNRHGRVPEGIMTCGELVGILEELDGLRKFKANVEASQVNVDDIAALFSSMALVNQE